MKYALTLPSHPITESANTQPMHIGDTVAKLNANEFQVEAKMTLVCVLLRVMYVQPGVCSLMNIAVRVVCVGAVCC